MTSSNRVPDGVVSAFLGLKHRFCISLRFHQDQFISQFFMLHCKNFLFLFKWLQWLKISSRFTVSQNTVFDSFLFILLRCKLDDHHDFFQKLKWHFLNFYLALSFQQRLIFSHDMNTKMSNLILWDASLCLKTFHLKFYRSVMNIAWNHCILCQNDQIWSCAKRWHFPN